MGFKTFRDRLVLILVVGIPILWILAGTVVALPEAALGASIAMWTLCIQFYVRKKAEGE